MNESKQVLLYCKTDNYKELRAKAYEYIKNLKSLYQLKYYYGTSFVPNFTDGHHLYYVDMVEAIPIHDQSRASEILIKLADRKVNTVLTTTTPRKQWHTTFSRPMIAALSLYEFVE